jgi:hypothetical protein
MAAMNRAFPTVLAGLLAGLHGCVPLGGGNDGGACPGIACGSAYRIDFNRAGSWTPATYTVKVTADGVTGSCDIILPLSCDRGPRCMGTLHWIPSVSGCALDPGHQSIDGISFERSTPTRVEVRVEEAGRLLGAQTFSPVYKTTTSASGCLTCTQAPTERLPLTQ